MKRRPFLAHAGCSPFRLAGLLGLALLAACGPSPAPEGINDPLEENNRAMHQFNKAVDRGVVRPSAFTYGDTAPGPLRQGISNFADNLAVPGHVVNNILQGRPGKALENTGRFVVNTTLGVGGLFDPATGMGIEGDPTDFGETLHVWGAGEGNYVELPFIGPSTERDMIGKGVDIVLDPFWFILPTTEAYYALGIQVADALNDRDRYSATIDSILYESADSYAQARLLYLQNRRFELGQTTTDGESGDFVDPYEDPYGN
jgi:phospholipid-binding lipoprotein MlaA